MSMPNKKYGLITPGNVFAEESDDDSSAVTCNKYQMFEQNSSQKKQFEIIHKNAVKEDSSIFLYDEVFDELEKKKNEAKIERKTQEAKKPKYISKLIETAEKRKKEYERRIERQVQKERTAEGEQFKDKESFVTSAYRQKLEEIKQAELQERHEEYLESIGDVTKQPDISGFYRHIYSQKIGCDETSTDIKDQAEKIDIKKGARKNYRKRENSVEDDETTAKGNKIEHLKSNLDADSDFSVESSSEETDEERLEKTEEEKAKEPENSIEKADSTLFEKKIQIELVEDLKPPKPKVNIWAKRTIGSAFDEALRKYFDRKSVKG